MKRTLIFGAGFSCAVSPKMPTTVELGHLVLDRLRSKGTKVPPNSLIGSQFEEWLSRLAEAQPDLDEAQNLENRALFVRISRVLRESLIECQQQVLTGSPHWWLQRLVGALHYSNATVITFNYDMLIEYTVSSLLLWDASGNKVRADDVIRNLPPLVEPAAGGFSFQPVPAQSFRYLKLHGSLDAFWVPGDATGATIGRWRSGSGWGRPMNESTEQRHQLLPGRDPFLVPPAAAKSTFYNNPLSRELWRTAATSLREADEVVLVGYSIPATDLVTSGMLRESLASRDLKVAVVDLAPEGIVGRLTRLGVDPIQITAIPGDSACADYVEQLDRALEPDIGSWDEFGDLPLAVGRYAAELPVCRLANVSRDGVATLDVAPSPGRPLRSLASSQGLVTANILAQKQAEGRSDRTQLP